MAMGGRSRREAENAIASCRPFKNSTGSFYGTRGSTRTLGWLESHTEARRIRELLSRAVYVVWSYGTPISFVSETEDGDRTAYYVDEHHSMTTSHHQGVARVGMGEYETIGARRPARRPRRERRPVQQSSDRAQMRYYPVQSEPVQPEEIDVSSMPDLDFSNRRGYVPESSVGYQNGRTETEQERTMRRLLDPRYANPDWVPDRDWEADRAAERRDMERVEREGAWRP
jgi:hypothetical protein